MTIARIKWNIEVCRGCQAVKRGGATKCLLDPTHDDWREAIGALVSAHKKLIAGAADALAMVAALDEMLYTLPKWITWAMAEERASSVEPGGYLVRKGDDYQFNGAWEGAGAGALNHAILCLAARGLRTVPDEFGIRVETIEEKAQERL